MPIAFTRAPGARLAECQLTHIARAPIDARRAAAQHAAYEAALAALGCALVRVPDLDAAPDGVFVEDMAVLLDGVAVIARPGNAARQVETESVAATLARHFQVVRLAAGRLDGGDVLRIGTDVFVGLSARTDEDGVAALQEAVAGLGVRVKPVKVMGCLHLKSAVTWLGQDGGGRGWLLANPDWADMAAFGGMAWLRVAEGEDSAANVLRLGGTVLMPAGAPGTHAMLEARGYRVTTLDTSELQKAEAGMTCMSLIGDPSHT